MMIHIGQHLTHIIFIQWSRPPRRRFGAKKNVETTVRPLGTFDDGFLVYFKTPLPLERELLKEGRREELSETTQISLIFYGFRSLPSKPTSIFYSASWKISLLFFPILFFVGEFWPGLN